VLACGGTRSGGAPLTRSEERSLDAFFSLLGRAARLHLLRRQERDRGDLLARALSALDHAVLLVDERAHITEANRAGRRMLDRGDGLLSVRGVVAARDARAQGELRAMIRHAAATHTTASLVIPKQTPGTHLLVDVIGGPWGTRARCLVLIRDPAAKRSRFDLAMRLYGLTPAEARVADALTEGRSPREIADDFGVAPGTVKNQLKQVFAKVGVRRQAELVSVLAPLTDLRGDPEER
jgi:DNA-binding CsgD family transcriptional regulator